jgi:hypothetical protein
MSKTKPAGARRASAAMIPTGKLNRAEDKLRLRPTQLPASPVEPPHFDADGRFIHRCCVCGEQAFFGYGVSLRQDKLGVWYCGEHRPQPQPPPENPEVA